MPAAVPLRGTSLWQSTPVCGSVCTHPGRSNPMSEPDRGGWRAALFVRQLQLACGVCARVPVDGRVAAAVRDAVESLAWNALDTPGFVVTRGILLAFMVKLARRCARHDAVFIEL